MTAFRPPLRLLGTGIRLALIAVLAAGCDDEGDDEEEEEEIELEDDDEDGWAEPQDCDDDRRNVHPGASEACDGVDDDCDGVVDDHPEGGVEAWLDIDRDGWGDPATRDTWCGNPETDTRPWVSNDGDCDDTDIRVNPAGSESCAIEGDDDCDGGENDPGAIGCTPWYEDLDGDGFGVELSACICEAEGGWRATVAGDCDDADAAVNEGCANTGARGLAQADVAIVGEPGFDGAGAVVAPAGDSDGDGWPDLLVASADGRGRARWWLLRGPFDADQDLSAATAAFNEASVSVAAAVDVASGADLDGDGIDDLVMAAEGVVASSGARYGAVVYVIDGSLTGNVDLAYADASLATARTTVALGVQLAVTPGEDDSPATLLVAGAVDGVLWRFDGPLGEMSTDAAAATWSGAPNESFGAAVAAAGDVDGDGVADQLIGVPGAGADDPGTVWLVSSSAAGDLTESDATAVMEGPSASARVGSSVAGLGDVNGDGYDDIGIGGAMSAPPVADAGAVFVVYGPISADLSLADADATVSGADVLDRADKVARAGDLDGDGAADLAIGAPGVDHTGAGAGAAFVFYGPLSGTLRVIEADLRLYGVAAANAAGTAVEGAGDLDLDGFDDLLIGAPGLDVGGDQAGGAYIIRGSAP